MAASRHGLSKQLFRAAEWLGQERLWCWTEEVAAWGRGQHHEMLPHPLAFSLFSCLQQKPHYCSLSKTTPFSYMVALELSQFKNPLYVLCDFFFFSLDLIYSYSKCSSLLEIVAESNVIQKGFHFFPLIFCLNLPYPSIDRVLMCLTGSMECFTLRHQSCWIPNVLMLIYSNISWHVASEL